MPQGQRSLCLATCADWDKQFAAYVEFLFLESDQPRVGRDALYGAAWAHDLPIDGPSDFILARCSLKGWEKRCLGDTGKLIPFDQLFLVCKFITNGVVGRVLRLAEAAGTSPARDRAQTSCGSPRSCRATRALLPRTRSSTAQRPSAGHDEPSSMTLQQRCTGTPRRRPALPEPHADALGEALPRRVQGSPHREAAAHASQPTTW